MELSTMLMKMYHSRSKMYRKIYYEKNRKRILDYNNKRYSDRLLKGEVKFTRKEFVIKFD